MKKKLVVVDPGESDYQENDVVAVENIKDMDNYLIQIVKELKVLGWLVGVIFNRTGIVLFKNQVDLEKSYWKSNLDFEIL